MLVHKISHPLQEKPNKPSDFFDFLKNSTQKHFFSKEHLDIANGEISLDSKELDRFLFDRFNR